MSNKIKMKQTFKRVVLYARPYRANQGVGESLHRLVDFLAKRHQATFQDADTAASYNLQLPVLKREDMNKDDLIIVVGGDGSLLAAARMAIHSQSSVIGINRGRLGFLTDISPNDIDSHLSAVLDGHYSEEKRFLLHTCIHNKDQIYFEGNALNDVVFSRGNGTHLVEFDVYINQQLVSHYRSDGIILATLRLYCLCSVSWWPHYAPTITCHSIGSYVLT